MHLSDLSLTPDPVRRLISASIEIVLNHWRCLPIVSASEASCIPFIFDLMAKHALLLLAFAHGVFASRNISKSTTHHQKCCKPRKYLNAAAMSLWMQRIGLVHNIC